MCGILGFYGQDLSAIDQTLLMTCANRIRHRGPDHMGFYESDHFRGASVRLSIIDLVTGNQPITSPDERFTIIFNGEVYNYRELRKSLLAKGYSFRTSSDTEVLLLLFIDEGIPMVKKLEGQFSFIIYDRVRKELYGARDRWGITPFFFVRIKNYYCITSEMKALKAIPGHTFAFDTEGLQQLSWCWSNIPPRTVWQNISELPVGHYIHFKLNAEPELVNYYDLCGQPVNTNPLSLNDTIEYVKETFVQEVEKHMIADVPVGAYLSGGIDSSVLTAIASKIKRDPVNTFSVTFEETEYDESEAQLQLVNKLNVRHTSIKISNRDISDHFPAAVYHAEKPLFRNAPVPLFLLSKKTNELGIKTILSGEGSDEVFWGYDTYRELIIRRLWQRNPDSEWRPSLFSKIFPYFPQYQDKKAFKFLKLFYLKTLGNIDHPLYPMLPRFENGYAINQVFNDDLRIPKESLEAAFIDSLPGPAKEISLLKKAQMIELRTLLPGYLLSSQGDRMLNAHSVEGRFPFLSNKLSEILWNTPDTWKIKGLTDKYILRQAFKGEIPESIRTRPKFAYRAPDVKAFFPDPSGYVRFLLSESFTKKAGVFNPATVAAYAGKFNDLKPDQMISMKDNMSLVFILSTHLLYYFFIEKNEYASLQ